MAEVRFTQDGKQYAYDYEKMGTLEAIELKKMTGWTVKQWVPELEEADAEAMRAFVWLARKKAGDLPDCKYSEFDFPLLEVMASFEADGPPTPDPTKGRTSRPRSRHTAR